MKFNEKFTVDKNYANTRIDKWLKLNTQKFPQSFVEKLLRSGKIKVNNKKIKSSYKLQLEDEIFLQFSYEEKKENEKFSYRANLKEYKEIRNNIIFENHDYLILNKPSGISVQSGTKSPKNLIDILNKFSEDKKFYLVHRIDKETSGIIVFACNRLFAQTLSEQFRNKEVKKSYLAILYGSIPRNEGTLDHDLVFKVKNQMKTFKAETDFSVLSKNKDFSSTSLKKIMNKDKKPFKQTGLGKILLSVVPNFVKGASKVLPDSGVLGVIKNLIDTDPDLTDEEKDQAHKHLVELYELEVMDRDSAREREVKLRKYGLDWMFNATGIVGLLAFAFLVYTVVTTQVPESNKEIFIHLLGIVEGVALSIFGYYFGSAKKENR